jgi:hypothetical protein
MSVRSVRFAFILVLGTLFGAGAYAGVRDGGQAVAAEPAVSAPPTPIVPPPPTTTTTSTTTTTLPPTTTTTTIPPDPDRGWLVIHGTGDVALDPDYIPNLRRYGYGFAWEGLGALFLRDHLTVVNLECSPSRLGTPFDKAFTFRCDPDALPYAVEAGIEVMNLANNHGQDFGKEAMLDGRANVIAAGAAPVGVGKDLAEATKPAIFELEGWTVAVLGFGGVVPWEAWLATEDRAGMASGDDIPTMVGAVRRAKTQADLVVVTIHWGRELDTQPLAEDVERAEAMIEAGADIIIGHHQHRLNPLTFIDGKPVAWGMGNFVWPRLSEASATTAVARFVVSPEGDIDACLIPAFIGVSGRPELRGEPTCAPPVEPREVPDAG